MLWEMASVQPAGQKTESSVFAPEHSVFARVCVLLDVALYKCPEVARMLQISGVL